MEESQKALLEGLDRSEVHWNPSINYDLCNNCGICLDYCKHGVYEKDSEKIKVVQPTGCVVLCNNCENLCPDHAISFPTKISFLKEVRNLRKTKK
jgi:NAD-dependent dihydropyrimidine dehydrogenase PreA subunit